jgi:hypothetical protein
MEVAEDSIPKVAELLSPSRIELVEGITAILLVIGDGESIRVKCSFLLSHRDLKLEVLTVNCLGQLDLVLGGILYCRRLR